MANERDLLETIERLIDEWGIGTVLQATADIALIKADHILETWQDEPLAKQWKKDADRVQHAASWAKRDRHVLGHDQLSQKRSVRS